MEITKEKLIGEFGTETALGVMFEREDGVLFPAVEYDLLPNEEHENHDYVSILKRSGLDAVCCTNYATEVMLSYPKHTKIFGFANEENPDCKVVKEELHPGGHDFALVNNRFLVDPWINFLAGVTDQVVFDLNDTTDKAFVDEWYGSQENWELMDEAMKFALEIKDKISFQDTLNEHDQLNVFISDDRKMSFC